MKLNRTRSIHAARLFTLLACMFLMCMSVFGQGSEGRILGTVLDQSGASIPGAKVTVLDVDRGTARSLTTDASGAYNAPKIGRAHV